MFNELIIYNREDNDYYTATEIARRLGMFSINNNPHANAVSAIIEDLNISSEFIFKKLSHRHYKDGKFVKYFEVDMYLEIVMDLVAEWLMQYNYPDIIFSKKQNRRFKVKYTDGTNKQLSVFDDNKSKEVL